MMFELDNWLLSGDQLAHSRAVGHPGRWAWETMNKLIHLVSAPLSSVDVFFHWRLRSLLDRY